MTDESLDNLSAAFRDWRSSKRTVKERVPDALIERARRAASVHGAGPVAYRLRISRERLTPAPTPTVNPPTQPPMPGYSRIEIAAPPRSHPPLVEAETPAGVKLRVFAITPDTVGLLSSFCRAGGSA
jgi:hypothetical protein